MENKTIEVRNVSKLFDGEIVLDNVSCIIDSNDINVIIGASGAGKSTLFRCIAGLEMIDSGEIYINGELVSSKDVHVHTSKRGVGVVFQDFALFPHLTVEKNVSYGVSKLDSEEVARLLHLVGMSEHKDKKPEQLSGGQQQRVALARTIASKPKYILFDEAFNAFDMQMKQVIKAEILRVLKMEGITPIFITHNQKEAFSWSTKIIVLNDKKIVQQGTPEEIYYKPANLYVANYVAATSILRGFVKDESTIELKIGDLKLGKDDIKAPVGSYVSFAFRAESLYEDETGEFEGVIEEIEFEGSYYGFVILSNNKHVHMHTLNHKKHKVGDSIKFSINHERMIMLAYNAVGKDEFDIHKPIVH